MLAKKHLKLIFRWIPDCQEWRIHDAITKDFIQEFPKFRSCTRMKALMDGLDKRKDILTEVNLTFLEYMEREGS